MGTLFGTDGIRGKAGEPPLDDDNLLRLGRAIGRVLGRSGRGTPRVVIGRDTRESGPGILRELAEGLKQQGAAVRSAGVVPTPAVSLLARSDSFDAGIAISASHNPYQDNGLKIFGNEGGKLPDELEAAIESELAAMGDVERMGSPAPVDEPTLRSRHREWLRDRAQSWGLDLSGRKLVVDAAHGAAAEAAAQLFSELGAEVESLGDSPTGTNINDGRGSLYPDELGVRVRSVGAELGIALDGDADRLIMVDEDGAITDGDHVLLITATAMLARGELGGGAVVGTVMTNLGLEKALKERGLGLRRAAVGDRFVHEDMVASGCNLGGEQSGHVIFLDEAPTGDGQLSALQVLRALSESGQSLKDAAAQLVRAPQRLINVRVPERRALDELTRYGELVATWQEKLTDVGRMLVRYSGTEPLVRVMVEGHDEEMVERCAEELADCLADELGGQR